MELKDYLLKARKPSRYVGCEFNSTRKNWNESPLRFALCFPDAYEIGMSHLGLRILYHVLNSDSRIACERFFAPWTDMEALLREGGALLGSIESGRPLRDFDIAGFSLQHELNYTCVLQVLDLGGVPLLASDRKAGDPLVLGGGPCALNPEPLAPFFDAFLAGEGEEAVLEISEAVLDWKEKGRGDRNELLSRLGRIEGVYVPAHFTPSFSGRDIERVVPSFPDRGAVRRRIVADFDSAPFPDRWIVPFNQIVHDRVAVEIQRGCTRGCRFCQAGMIYRPARQRSAARILDLAEKALRASGYEELSFLSLSAGDHPCLDEMLQEALSRFAAEKVALSLPSLRAETLSPAMASLIKSVRKTGFTLAPEAGAERLRWAINKPIRDEEIEAAIEAAFGLGWELVKLYFMVGLPTETEKDLDAIPMLVERLARKAKSSSASFRRRVDFNVTVSIFIPKPHTPFQWERFIGAEEARERLGRVKTGFRRLRAALKSAEPGQSMIEAVLARGDRRLGAAVLEAYRGGSRFDGWTECFNLENWKAAIAAVEGFSGWEDAVSHFTREIPEDRLLPWDHISALVDRKFLVEERRKTRVAELTPDCLDGGCPGCGACDFDAVKPVKAQPHVAASGPVLPREAPPQAARRFRIHFSKTGPAAFLSQIETQTAVLRSVLRAALRPAFSQGMHPKQKVSFSSALPVGVRSEDEIFETEIYGGAPAEEIASRLGAAFPQGMRVTGVRELAPQSPSLSKSIAGAVFRIEAEGGRDLRQVRAAGISLPAGVEVKFEGSTARVVLRQAEGRTAGLKEAVAAIFGAESPEWLRITKEQTIILPSVDG